MDTLFHNTYYKYFLWNNGLINYYFRKSRGEILLYVDETVLEEIGTSVGIEATNYKKDFIESVEKFCGNYNMYICPEKNHNSDVECTSKTCNYRNPSLCLTSQKRRDVLAVAAHICLSDIKYYHKFYNNRISFKMIDGKRETHDLPFFAIVMYVILKFDNGITQEWANAGNNIAQNSRPIIPVLWKKIHDFDKRFDPDASIYERENENYGDYAGRILYHLPLSASTRNKIQDAIYKSSAWKLVDTKSFIDIIGLIKGSIRTAKANTELNKILLNYLSATKHKSLYARKIQSVIDDFDIDEYRSKLESRAKNAEDKNILISGQFALGIYFPDYNEDKENSIVLLTTVQHAFKNEKFEILEGSSGTLDGYNTNFVSVNDSTSVELKKYTLKEGAIISNIPIDDVIFFYEYDENLYIQTREIKPARSYIIAVKSTEDEKFSKWCKDNGNTFFRWDPEDTKELFGKKWIIYDTAKIQGEYYEKRANNDSTSSESAILLKGGIKSSNGRYFINSLPYFEVPEEYDIDELKIFINVNGHIFKEYSKIVKDRQLILDITGMPNLCNGIADIDICLEHSDDIRFHFNIIACSQTVEYNEENIHTFNNFGILTDTQQSCSYCGNRINLPHQTNNEIADPYIQRTELDQINEDFYFTNLLAACCYSDKRSEITHGKLRKCVGYAASRLNIDIQREGFIKKVKHTLANTGIISINYSNGKCQAIAPSFMKVPFSQYGYKGAKLIMLCGCYTRAFINDLCKYCNEKDVQIFIKKGESTKDEDKFLPPIILIDNRFDAEEFGKTYQHQCDNLDHDLASSLLNLMPSQQQIANNFNFKNNNDALFTQCLEPSNDSVFPVIRKTKRTNRTTSWFIESEPNKFASIPDGFIPWASFYCHRQRKSLMIVLHNKEIYMPQTLLLPHYIHRTLYLMNLGGPSEQKVFILGQKDNNYFSMMNKYDLRTKKRSELFAKKITGDEDVDKSNLVRKAITPKHHTIEYWKEVLNGRKYRKHYLIVRYGESVVAIVHQRRVYIAYNGKFLMLESDKTVNETLTFIIKENWIFSSQHDSIGLSKNCGSEFEPCFNISNEEIEMPIKSNYKIEKINIL